MKLEVAVRPIEPSDLQDLYELWSAPEVMHGTMGLPSLSMASLQKKLFEKSPDELRHDLVAVHERKVIGYAGLLVGRHPRVRHAAGLYISVHPTFHGRGVGRRLMEALCDLADNWLGLRRVWLEVNHDNERAIALYEKMGFQKEGRLRGNILRAGEYIDSFVMGRLKG